MATRISALVTIRWGDDVIATRRLSGDAEATVGAAPGAVAAVPLESIGCAAFVLARVRRGRAVARVPEGCVASCSSREGDRLVAGPSEIALDDGGSVTLWIAGFHLIVAANAEERLRWAAPPRRDGAYGSLPHIAVAAVVHALAFGAAGESALASELEDERAASVDAMRGYLAAAELRAAAPDPATSSDVGSSEGKAINDHSGNGEPGGGARAGGQEGAMGSRLSRAAEARRFALPGDEHEHPAIADASGFSDAQTFGMIGLLAEPMHAPSASFGDLAAVGPDAIAAQGSMWARTLGEHFGSEGLGLSGIGEGGGGEGLGVGLDRIGTVGHTHGLAGPGTGGDGTPMRGIGGGSWGGSWCGCHSSMRGYGRHGIGVGIRAGEATTAGKLPPEVIQRIVRQNFGRFRLCYENGLTKNPALAGRVSTKFLIGAGGAVVTAADGGSDLPDPGVVSCVVRAFYGLSFPEPPGGATVTVTYPIAFSPETI
jgi:hypothetical protein